MMEAERNEIVFFDLETSVPWEEGQRHTMLEFGAILVCPRRLGELYRYSTLIRPPYLSPVTERIVNDKGITTHDLLSAPPFSEVADHIYDLLDGRVWAGHNILAFDCLRISEAFEQIGRTPPRPKGHIDSRLLLLNTFGNRAGDMKMATLASYFRLGSQKHRSIDDVLLNLEVLKYCSTVLFLETSYPILLHNEILSASAESEEFLEAHEISTYFMKACHRDSQKMILLHKNVPLQMRSRKMKPKIFRDKCISTRYFEPNGKPRLSFLVEPTFESCCILKECESLARHYFSQCRSNSEWRPLLQSQHDSEHSIPPVRIHILTSGTGNTAQILTDIYEKAPTGQTQKLILPTVDVDKLDELIVAGKFIDADYTFEIYDYQQYAGIKIIARRLTLVF